MKKHVIETVIFQLEDGVSKKDFLKAASCSTDFAIAQPGFVAWRLSCTDDNIWIEHIEWKTMVDVKNAAAKIGKIEAVMLFLKCIKGPSVKLMHSDLEMALD
ncbi:hypothetical protein [Parasulfitobacter algicola]|uniref:ABM domain-containing protein n=1 Tax=Parasulfitobacter algicola TaxID=2614809 RepID=A0ABX2ISH1_9RHOB|nr:hypothetical protein [Sulfitobacter algicola]NSX53304.1 hypothetical protein [Sulfitobacter algicola]